MSTVPMSYSNITVLLHASGAKKVWATRHPLASETTIHFKWADFIDVRDISDIEADLARKNFGWQKMLQGCAGAAKHAYEQHLKPKTSVFPEPRHSDQVDALKYALQNIQNSPYTRKLRPRDATALCTACDEKTQLADMMSSGRGPYCTPCWEAGGNNGSIPEIIKRVRRERKEKLEKKYPLLGVDFADVEVKLSDWAAVTYKLDDTKIEVRIDGVDEQLQKIKDQMKRVSIHGDMDRPSREEKKPFDPKKERGTPRPVSAAWKVIRFVFFSALGSAVGATCLYAADHFLNLGIYG